MPHDCAKQYSPLKVLYSKLHWEHCCCLRPCLLCLHYTKTCKSPISLESGEDYSSQSSKDIACANQYLLGPIQLRKSRGCRGASHEYQEVYFHQTDKLTCILYLHVCGIQKLWRDDVRPLFWLPWFIIVVWFVPLLNRYCSSQYWLQSTVTYRFFTHPMQNSAGHRLWKGRNSC